MSTNVAYLHDEQEQKTEAIKHTIEDYIHGNPHQSTFCFFLPTTQDRDEIKQAAAKASLETGKRVHVIYPVNANRRMRMSAPETTNPPVTKSRNAVLKEIRARFGADQAHTTWLIDALVTTWDTTDQFTSIFGAEAARTYLQAENEPQEENDDNEHE
jgi:hypothetical protein